MNNPTKQKDIIRWHKEMNNLVSIVTETKLRSKIRSWIADKFDGVQVFTSGLDSGHLGVGVAVIMDVSLARHVCKISEVSGWLLSIKLLFKSKLSVLILGLYAGASLAVQLSQAGEINSLIAKTVNESFFIILGGNFNEDGSRKCASFRKCLDLGLANSLVRSPAVKLPTWANSRGARKMIDYSADDAKWNKFKGATAANATMFSDDFIAFQQFSDLDAMWDIVCKIMVLSADEVFKKKWFKDYDGVFTRDSSKFHKLELLISKLVKASQSICHDKFISLLDVWSSLDNNNASVVRSLFLSSSPFDTVWSALSKIRKTYYSLKMMESKRIEKSQIKSAINKRMESFELNKSHTIQSVLECPFHKVVLDHLVVDNELILKPGPVRSRVDEIMEGWTRKHRIVPDVSDYRPLDYIFDEAFSGVMQPIEFLELFGVVSDLPIDKAAGLSGISNELWIHNNRSVLNMLLEAWVSIISKPYEWEGVLTNTRPIALIETAHKILSKILSDRISLTCSAYNILYGDNFSVLKGTTIQTPIFAIGSVVEDALEKNRELWLVLQNMRKAYDSCLVRIKMCGKFIRFFGNIYRNWTNQIMMDFGLTDGYSVHNGLDQGEENVYRYRLNSHFVSRSGCIESQAGFSTFFTAGAFVDDTIWINDISINNDKTVAIPINSRISNPSLFISGSPISITKKGKSHQYFGIFLSTDGLSKPSLAKAHSDIRFFSNLVLKKAVSDKQFLYLVLAVLHPIVSYRTQFSFIPVSVYDKWDALICKSLKLKSGLPLDFPSDIIHHPSFYDLKSFSQYQSESKVALLISFANSCGVLAHICVSVSNNFLSGLVRILLECNLSLSGSLASSFRFHDRVPISTVLGESLFFKYMPSLQQYGIVFVDQLQDCRGDIFNWYTFKQWKKLNPRGPVPEWFRHSVAFLSDALLFSLALCGVGPVNICGSNDFVSVCNCLSQVGANSLSMYTDGSVVGPELLSFLRTLTWIWASVFRAIVLALECVPVDHSVCLFSDSQAALDACKSEVNLVCSDFCNQCWIECWHIRNIIYRKNLRVSWHKIKSHFGVLENDCANSITDTAALSDRFFSPRVAERFLLVDGGIVSGNFRHFVRDVFHAVCRVCWEISSGSGFLAGDLHLNVDWLTFSGVWHPDLHMATGFTSRHTADICTYLIKTLHC
ncbi:hypothetical protein G9A89_002820 [Geosiphon pyriformis]|nr:hypothetical protein G9A89_002820 [Geosiphon pyriformis]